VRPVPSADNYEGAVEAVKSGPRVPLAAVVLTFNEERNLDACLGSLASCVSELHVVDSGSTDETLAIAARHGAQVTSHAFETHARQWQWALQSLPIEADWVLALDADQRVTPELAVEIVRLVEASDSTVAGAYVKRRQVFRGRWIRHGGYYPKYLLKLVRRSAVWMDDGDLVDHHFHVRGTTVLLEHDIVEDNQNEASIAAWTAKHNRYAVLQAQEQLARGATGTNGIRPAFFGSPDQRVLWLKQLWNGLPLYWRPALYFGYRYVLRLGFLDGREGFVFHVLQAFWYRLLVDINIDEMRRTGNAPSGKTTSTS
jgi:glycosyltransferase involved in cell wall biosynthesis